MVGSFPPAQYDVTTAMKVSYQFHNVVAKCMNFILAHCVQWQYKLTIV